MDNHMLKGALQDVIPAQVIEEAELVVFEPGAYIINPNEPVKYFYLLTLGSAKLTHEDPEAAPLIIDIYHSGDFMGEMEMVGLSTTDRSISALTRCELRRFSKEQFFKLWTETKDFSTRLLYIHCQRLLRAGDDKVNSERTILRDRVFRLIQLNLNEKGFFCYTKQILSEMAGVSIRSLNRSLKELEEDRLIIVSGGAIRLFTES
jgi:CRP-like cAMP-binding protein